MKLPELTRVPGQGEERDPSDALLRSIVQGLETVRYQSAAEVWDRRQWSNNVRYCLWNGQSDDGRKRDEALGDEGGPAFPFDGASDARVRLADFILRVQVATLKQASKRASVRIRGMEANDVDTAGHLNTLAYWLLTNRLSGDWRMHLERLAQWGLGDSPAVSLLHIYQDRREIVRLQSMTIDDLILWLEENLSIDPADPMAQFTIGDILINPDRREELIDLISQQYPLLKRPLLKKSIKTLLAEGRTTFPVVEVHHNEPRIEALRMWEDVFVPSYTRDPDTCQVVYVRRWLTLAQIEEKENLEGWDSDVIDAITGRTEDNATGHEGQSYIEEIDAEPTSGLREWDGTTRHDGLYEIFTAYIRGVNDDGVTGIYTIAFSGFHDEPLTPLRLLDYPHGGFPFVWYVREYTSTCLLDSRGLCEILQTDQDFLKTMRDLSADHAQLFTLPPFEHNMTSPEREVRFSPLALIRVGSSSRFAPVQIPAGSDLPLKHSDLLLKQVSLYTGVPVAEINAIIQATLTQDMVDDWIDVLRASLHMLLQLAVHLMDETQLRDICNAPDLDVQALRDGLRTLRDIQIEFNSAAFDINNIKVQADIIQSIRAFDTEKRIDDSELVDWLVRQLSPTLANRAVRPVEIARASEIEDEKANISLIEAGIDPQMVESGQNYQARLDVLLRWLQFRQDAAMQNAMPPLSPVQVQIAQARIQHLQGQLQQQENAVIGRTMSQKVSPV